MAQKRFSGELSNGKVKVQVAVTILVWHENDIHFVYSPALDITGYGKSTEEAQQSFEVVLQEYIKYTSNKKTLFNDLEKLGWMVNRKKRKLHAPDFEDMLNENEEIKKIISKEGSTSHKTDVQLLV